MEGCDHGRLVLLICPVRRVDTGVEIVVGAVRVIGRIRGHEVANLLPGLPVGGMGGTWVEVGVRVVPVEGRKLELPEDNFGRRRGTIVPLGQSVPENGQNSLPGFFRTRTGLAPDAEFYQTGIKHSPSISEKPGKVNRFRRATLAWPQAPRPGP